MRNNLKEIRIKANMTQSEVAEILNIGLRHYQRIEAGETIGKVETWDMLEDMFHVSQRKLRENIP